MAGAISPVKAPSFSQNTSCAPMAISLPRAPSTAAETAVKGGAITMSHRRTPLTKVANAEKKVRVSACVLNIFQLPAITRRRFVFASLISLRHVYADSVHRSVNFDELIPVCESFHSRQFSPAQEFQ